MCIMYKTLKTVNHWQVKDVKIPKERTLKLLGTWRMECVNTDREENVLLAMTQQIL